ncbi:MAG: PorV/PorQ family protein [Candidatus Marinimicrobia bacterium]|nr:PorV/PorQ family protein [Candidatus Neomarinimicrobiota bacterium]
MKRIISIILLVLIAFSFGLAKDQKLAQTGMQFLSVATDGRGAAMGQAMTAIEAYSMAFFYNPASAAKMTKTMDLTASQNNWIAGIKHNAFSVAFNPSNGRFGVFGITARNIDYGDVDATIVAENDLGYIDLGVMNPTALSVSVGYARSLTDKFAVGGNVGYVVQQLGQSVVPYGDSLQTKSNVAGGITVDFGTLYYTGWKSLAFGMSVRNFSGEIKYEDEGFQLPLTFSMGLSMDVLDLLPEKPQGQSLKLSVDALHYRSHPEQLNIGLEYGFANLVFARAGYRTSEDIQALSFGIGLNIKGIVVDYAYTPTVDFVDVQRFTIGFAF